MHNPDRYILEFNLRIRMLNNTLSIFHAINITFCMGIRVCQGESLMIVNLFLYKKINSLT